MTDISYASSKELTQFLETAFLRISPFHGIYFTSIRFTGSEHTTAGRIHTVAQQSFALNEQQDLTKIFEEGRSLLEKVLIKEKHLNFVEKVLYAIARIVFFRDSGRTIDDAITEVKTYRDINSYCTLPQNTEAFIQTLNRVKAKNCPEYSTETFRCAPYEHLLETINQLCPEPAY